MQHQSANVHPMRRLLSNRRGLLAGAAALVGAGLAKLGAAERAEATHGGVGNDVVYGTYNNLGTGAATVVGNSSTTAPAFSGANGFVPGFPSATFLIAADGLQGITNKSGGVGLRGIGPDYGVAGQIFRGGAPASNAAVGVLGQTQFGAGVRGEVYSGGNGTGVAGVAADCELGNNNDVGVAGSGRGIGNSIAGKTGVLGITDGSLGVGVQGWAIGSGTGVRGSANGGGGPDFSGSGIGVDGRSGSGKGVQGVSDSGNGVYGTIPSTSASNAIAIYGLNNSSFAGPGPGAGGFGVYGLSAKGHGLVGATAAAGGAAVVGATNGVAGAYAAAFYGPVLVNGAFTVAPGNAKSAAVQGRQGYPVRMYCVEAPEAWFEDFGTATLTNGRAVVDLDPDFDAVVKGDDYLVFPVAEGDCNGLFVSRKGPHRFVVEELKGGKSTLPFSYRLVSRRKDTVGNRLERVDIPKAPVLPKVEDLPTIPPVPVPDLPLDSPVIPVKPGEAPRPPRP